MQIVEKIVIDKPASDVWKVVALDFHKISDWMSSVPKSQQINAGTPVEGATMVGRVCQRTKDPNGLSVTEKITFYDDKNYKMHVEVVPTNGTIPIVKTNLIIYLNSINGNKSSVTFDADVELKMLGKILYLLIRLRIKKYYNEMLEELKYFVENGSPHPRTVAKS